MAIIKREGVSITPENLSSKDKKPSTDLRELVAKLPQEAKDKAPHFIAAIEKVEHMEKFAEGSTDTIERLKQKIGDLESGDQNLITGLQQKMDEIRAEQKIVLKTLMKAFAGHHGINVEASDIEDFLRLF